MPKLTSLTCSRIDVSERFQNISGTFDILPDTSTSDGFGVPGTPAWRYVEQVIHDVMTSFGMEEIRTPILEPTDLIARGVGEATDIVSKEMFAFERGDTSYVLRPEVTAPVMRAYLQHHLQQRGGTQRLYYIGACFRAERPQKGRFRQFHQFGCEIIGSSEPASDVESIAAMLGVYDALGITDYELRINSLGEADDRVRYREALRSYFLLHKSKLSAASLERLERNPLRLLDTKVEVERDLLSEAPRLSEFISEESQSHFRDVRSLLDDLGVGYEVDGLLVRGLDYYNRTAYELESPRLGAQSALGGGGRYDFLSTEVGSSVPVPAVGFAAGIERLFISMREAGISLPERASPDVFVAAIGKRAQRWAVTFSAQARKAGLRTIFDLQSRSMKAQMREANRSGVRFVIIVGDDELDNAVARVRDMTTADQSDVPIDQLTEHLTP